MSIYNFNVKKANGEILSMETFRGKTLLIVNTASKCGFTPQFEDLQKVYDAYSEQSFEILAFPCNQFGEQNPESAEESASTCQLNYGVKFPVFDKIDVNGENAHPLFTYLKDAVPYRELDETHGQEKLVKMLLSEKYPEHLLGNNIRWNFTKFLVSPDGSVLKRFESSEEPMEIKPEIEKVLIENSYK